MFFVLTESESHYCNMYGLRVGSTRWKTSDLRLQASGPVLSVLAAAACEHWPDLIIITFALLSWYEASGKTGPPCRAVLAG